MAESKTFDLVVTFADGRSSDFDAEEVWITPEGMLMVEYLTAFKNRKGSSRSRLRLFSPAGAWIEFTYDIDDYEETRLSKESANGQP